MYEIVKEEIQKNVGHPKKYPFANMEVGDCFYVPAENVAIGTLRVLARSYRLKLNAKFSVSVSDKGHRVQRIS